MNHDKKRDELAEKFFIENMPHLTEDEVKYYKANLYEKSLTARGVKFGWDACEQHLKESAPEMDFEDCMDAASKYLKEELAGITDEVEKVLYLETFTAGAYWRDEQLAAQIGALKSENEMLSRGLQGCEQIFKDSLAQANAEIERLKVDNDGLKSMYKSTYDESEIAHDLIKVKDAALAQANERIKEYEEAFKKELHQAEALALSEKRVKNLEAAIKSARQCLPEELARPCAILDKALRGAE
jgi:chromosome segregation ATPase